MILTLASNVVPDTDLVTSSPTWIFLYSSPVLPVKVELSTVKLPPVASIARTLPVNVTLLTITLPLDTIPTSAFLIVAFSTFNVAPLPTSIPPSNVKLHNVTAEPSSSTNIDLPFERFNVYPLPIKVTFLLIVSDKSL